MPPFVQPGGAQAPANTAGPVTGQPQSNHLFQVALMAKAGLLSPAQAARLGLQQPQQQPQQQQQSQQGAQHQNIGQQLGTGAADVLGKVGTSLFKDFQQPSSLVGMPLNLSPSAAWNS